MKELGLTAGPPRFRCRRVVCFRCSVLGTAGRASTIIAALRPPEMLLCLALQVSLIMALSDEAGITRAKGLVPCGGERIDDGAAFRRDAARSAGRQGCCA
jgi:hypothetical protein